MKTRTLTSLEKKTATTRKLALTSVFAALYAVLVVIFAVYSVFVPQVRFADTLLPLSILFGWPATLGVTIGAMVGNFVADPLTGFPSGSIGIDTVGGGFANLLAGLLGWKIGSFTWRIKGWNVTWLLATIVQTIVVTVIVGSYLSPIFGIPIDFSLIGILIGSLIAINIVGFIVLEALGRPQTLKALKAQGLVADSVPLSRIPDSK